MRGVVLVKPRQLGHRPYCGCLFKDPSPILLTCAPGSLKKKKKEREKCLHMDAETVSVSAFVYGHNLSVGCVPSNPQFNSESVPSDFCSSFILACQVFL